jgi:hypothetical protein
LLLQLFDDSVHMPPAFSQAALVVCWDILSVPDGLAEGSPGVPVPGGRGLVPGAVEGLLPGFGAPV